MPCFFRFTSLPSQHPLSSEERRLRGQQQTKVSLPLPSSTFSTKSSEIEGASTIAKALIYLRVAIIYRMLVLRGGRCFNGGSVAVCGSASRSRFNSPEEGSRIVMIRLLLHGRYVL
jgi:hypothetical protein